MALNEIVRTNAAYARVQPAPTTAYRTEAPTSFSEQFLEKPVVSTTYDMGISPTVCTWRGIPTIDDF